MGSKSEYLLNDGGLQLQLQLHLQLLLQLGSFSLEDLIDLFLGLQLGGGQLFLSFCIRNLKLTDRRCPAQSSASTSSAAPGFSPSHCKLFSSAAWVMILFYLFYVCLCVSLVVSPTHRTERLKVTSQPRGSTPQSFLHLYAHLHLQAELTKQK